MASNNEDFSFILKAVLDGSGISQDDIDKIAKKYVANIKADLDKTSLKSAFNEMWKDLRPLLNEKYGVKLPVTLDDAVLDKSINQAYVKMDKLAEKANKIQLSSDVTKLTTDYQKFGVVSQEVENNLKELKLAQEAVVNAKGTDRLATEIEKYNTKLAETKSSLKELTTTQVSMNQRTSQMTSMQEWMRKNKAATKLVGDEVNKLIEECKTCDAVRFNGIKNEFKELQVQAGKAGKLGSGTLEGLIEQGKKFAQWVGVSGVTMGFFNEIRQSISELKEVDTILTEISKTSNATKEQLKDLGDQSFETASKYGVKATDYLTGVQEMNRSGYYGEEGNQMAELSILAQSAGDMTKDIANNYLLATNAAYKYEGSVEKLNAVLDGQNIITNRNSVDMTTMAEATERAGSTAAMTGVKIEELSAMIGTIEASTKEAGEKVGTGIKSLLINLQNVSSDKITSTLKKANAEMTVMRNGIEQMRNPIQILDDLAETFNSLSETDPLKSEILTNIGQKYHANELSALLSNWDQYKKMLQDYSEGTGSAAREAEKSANNWEGSMNKLHNTWTDIVGNVLNSDAIVATVNSLNGLLSVINKITSALGSFGTISTTLSGILGAKGYGLTNYMLQTL